MKKIIGLLVFAYIAYLVFVTSCANPGMPSGGDKDSIPPVVLKIVPEVNSVNYVGNTATLTFNEFVIVDQLADKMVVSPPLPKKAVVRTKGKGFTINFGDSLRSNRTYSIDFKDGIVDNNERNPLEDFRIAFSTGPTLDTLMLGGYVFDSENMEPVENATIMMYLSSDTITAPKEKIPLYIAKSDKEGFYAFSNVAEGDYYLYAVLEEDNSMKYDQAGEKIAFLDSFAIPSFPISTGIIDLDSIAYYSLIDSLQKVNNIGAIDSLIRIGKDLFLGKKDSVRLSQMIIPGQLDADPLRPGRQVKVTDLIPYIMFLFEEDPDDQYLLRSKREQRNLIKFEFDIGVTDSFRINVIKPELDLADNWYIREFNQKRDSISIWITDTIVSRSDTLLMQVGYMMLDSLENPYMRLDTMYFNYSDPQVREVRRRRKDDEVKQIETFQLTVNAKNDFDPYNNISITAPEPLREFDFDKVYLYQIKDTIETKIDAIIIQDSILSRKFYMKHEWKFEEKYRLLIDSAAAQNFSGAPSLKIDQTFTIQKKDFYGTITLDLKNVPGNSIVQLLKNSNNEEVVKQYLIDKDGIVIIPFIHPEKYKIRLVVDRNNNGKWDTGNLNKRIQPERIIYFDKVLKIRSNFDNREDWVLPDDFQPKKAVDPDSGEKKQTGTSRFR